MNISEEQLILLEALAHKAGILLPTGILEVIPLNDGNMGSFQIGSNSHQMKEQVAEIHFCDEDGVEVSAALNTDSNNELFEVDIFKGDFSLLKKWPTVEDLQ